jgi:hypothetical protein
MPFENGTRATKARRRSRPQLSPGAAAIEAAVTTKCVPEKPPVEYGTQRLPIWQAGEDRRMAECHAQQDKERHEAQDKAKDKENVRLHLATQTTVWDAIQSWLLPLLQALAGGAMTFLWAAFIGSLRRRPVAQVEGGKAGAP